MFEFDASGGKPDMTHFFGYGSLVNRATHDYPAARPAHLSGWQRVWVHTAARPVAYLSVRPHPQTTIAGLVAQVPNGDWAALDDREAAYLRHPVTTRTDADPAFAAQVYAVPSDHAQDPQTAHPILLSYLDVVVQGFLREFGPSGAQDFFATTAGWHAPILNDRKSPKYPRAQNLSASETAMVDAALKTLRATIL